MKSICIIMAVYNGETYLAEQIDSILKNTCQNYTLHIFNDHSSDRSGEIIESYAKTYPDRIRIHEQTRNRGVVCNFLEGTRVMDADYYMFCDQDDVWLPDKIQHTLQTAQQAEAAEGADKPLAVFGDARVVDRDLQELAPSFQKQSGYHTDALDTAHILMENKLIGCTVLFNRALQQKITELPSEIRMHDWWIALLAASFGRIIYLDEPLLLYRQHGDNVVGNLSRGNYIRSRLAHLQSQREVLYQTCAQAGVFLQLYRSSLSPEQAELIRLFATIPEQGWFTRRYRILRYHFLKSGLTRNLGVLLVI